MYSASVLNRGIASTSGSVASPALRAKQKTVALKKERLETGIKILKTVSNGERLKIEEASTVVRGSMSSSA